MGLRRIAAGHPRSARRTPIDRRRAGFEIGIAVMAFLLPARREHGFGDGLPVRGIGDIGVDRGVRQRRVEAAVVAEIHVGVEPLVEDGDRGGPIIVVELDLLDQADGAQDWRIVVNFGGGDGLLSRFATGQGRSRRSKRILSPP